MKLTSKMATTRLANSDKCIVFWPFNEGSGTTFTDAMGGYIGTDASASHTANPHGPAIGIANGTALTGATGNITTIPATKVAVLIVGYQAVTTSGLATFNIGETTGARVGISANNPSTKDDDGTATTFTGITAAADGQDQFMLMALDIANATGYIHEAVNGTASAQVESKTIGTAAITVTAKAGFGNTGVRQEAYGVGLWVLDNLPSAADRNAALDYCVKNWTRGYKMLPAELT